ERLIAGGRSRQAPGHQPGPEKGPRLSQRRPCAYQEGEAAASRRLLKACHERGRVMKVKWVLLGLGAFAVLSAAGGTVSVLLALSLTKGVAEGGTNFLALLGEGQTQQAYLSTAKALRAQQDEASFTKAVRGLGLTEYASVSWHQRRIDNDQGRLEGAVTTK